MARIDSLDLLTLRYVLACADTGNLIAAGKCLGVRASTVSRRIRRVELELGLSLFERNNLGLRQTFGGQEIVGQIRRLFWELEKVRNVGLRGASGHLGKIQLGIRMPPVGEPLQRLFSLWRDHYPDVEIVIHEMNEREIQNALQSRRINVALMMKQTLCIEASSELLYREPIFLAVPASHPLSTYESVSWRQMRGETFLIQGWDDSQTAREFYAGLLGSNVIYRTHAASKQSVLALVASGYGLTLVTKSQSQVRFPDLLFRPVAESNACVDFELRWIGQNQEAVVANFVAFMREQTRIGRRA